MAHSEITGQSFGPPPSYTDAVAQQPPPAAWYQGNGTVPTMPLLAQPPMPAQATSNYHPTHLEGGMGVVDNALPQRDAFNMTKFIMLWSGSGWCHCVCCMFINLGFLGFGIALLIMIAHDTKNSSFPPISTIVLCCFAGVSFFMLCGSWCWTIIVTQCARSQVTLLDFSRKRDLDPTINYTSASCCFCIAAIFFLCTATGLVVDYFNTNYDGYSYCGDDSNSVGHCRVEILAFLVMWSLAAVFVCTNVLCYCSCLRKIVGQVFGCC